MGFDPSLLVKAIEGHYGEKPHPDVPEVKQKDYEAFARVAARMFNEATPQPQHVAAAYHAVTQSGVAPQEWERIWDTGKPAANKLLDRDPNIHDVMMLAGKQPSEIADYYKSHPHPQHPDVPAGDIARYYSAALYPARVNQGRPPNLEELGTFARLGYNSDDIHSHYSEMG